MAMLALPQRHLITTGEAMKTIGPNRTLIVCAVAMAGLTAVGNTVRAESLPEQARIDTQSRTNVVGRSSVELLRWGQSGGADSTRSIMAQRLGLDVASANDLSRNGGEQRLRGPGWKLTIARDGTSVQFRREASVPGSPSRIEPAELTQIGLTVINSVLAGVVELGPGEEIVPLRTRYERGGGQATTSMSPIPEVVFSNIIVFGRKVDGVPVVGPGSKVAIVFNSDRSLQAFNVDWRRLVHAGRSQEVAPQETVWNRASAFSSAVPNDSVDLRRMECGYVDVGARRRTDAAVQIGCSVSYAITRSGTGGMDTVSAHVDIIPAGKVVEPDAAWPEARILCTGSDFCGGAPPNQGGPRVGHKPP